jgi:two-component system LytT family response regulator
MEITCLIIDDEPLARQRVQNLAKKVPELLVLGEAKTGKMAIQMINELQPELIFLDIQMKDISGFDVLQALVVKPPFIVFVTAFNHYAVKAFDVLAFDYLLKPFKKERFVSCVDRITKQRDKGDNNAFNEKLNALLKQVSTTSDKQEYFKNKLPVKTGKTIYFIDTEHIKYIEASGSYIDIHTLEKTHVLRQSLSHVLLDIKNPSLIRIHRSTVINLNFLDNLIHSDYGEMDVKMKDGKRFRISQSYRKEFLEIIGR